MTKVVGIMQPTYIPWMGYFEMIANSDIFIFLDDVQFAKKSWQQRNRIKGANGEFWLTIPVIHQKGRFQNLNNVRINNATDWRHKHLKSIEMAYKNSPYFSQYIDSVRKMYNKSWDNLADFNILTIETLMKKIGITTPTIRSSSLNIPSRGNQKIIDLCGHVRSDKLYDAAGAVDFIDCAAFEKANITVTFQNYIHPEYPQLHGPFIPYLSTIDLIFNQGEKPLDMICSGAGIPNNGEKT